jgi:NurA-like 5'-3' nuclease
MYYDPSGYSKINCGKDGFNRILDKVTGKYKFASKSKLESHFIKHGDEFKGFYSNSTEYLKGAQDLIKNGHKVKYIYKGEVTTGYVRFMENTNKGVSKFEFVSINSNGKITTYHTKSGKKLWKTINGKNVPEITPVN